MVFFGSRVKESDFLGVIVNVLIGELYWIYVGVILVVNDLWDLGFLIL